MAVFLVIILFASALAILIGLALTGYKIGWGPFATLRYFNSVKYDISQNDYSYTREKKLIEGVNGEIVGYFYLPEDESTKREIVIFSHGYATEQWHNLNAAESLASAGVSVFIFDYCGGSIHAESEGKTTDMSILTEKRDLNDVIDAVKQFRDIDIDRISVLGYSQGGLVAALTAAERNDIYKLCLVYPAFTMFEEIKTLYNSIDEVPETQNRLGMKIGKKYFEDILSLDIRDIYSYVANYKGPVFLIHGTADQAVPYESSVKANEYYSNSELYLIEGAPHGFAGKDDIDFVKHAYEFLTSDRDL